MLFRKLVLLGGGLILLLAYHGGYLLRDWPWLFYYGMIAWWFSFSWHLLISRNAALVPGTIKNNEKSLPIVGQPQTHRCRQNDNGDSSLIINSIYYSSTNSNHTDSIINNGADCSYSDSSDSGCGGSD
ncbi:hypothetical protein NGI08_23470 [Klebsiella michiganensis]|uniref:hypothetical protein n=1 Tax=Klebsiella/Raoultella group TaxID=2890311 RepID=UPI0012B8B495|nr:MULTISPECIES: hypothetical protein [Klebsiella]MCF6690010.1 hypothetical protein [Raoultella terrigena]MEB8081741.1 hypothetical protein [Klebsiella michiganensis]